MSPKKRSPITTHILDTTLGKPAAGVLVQLEFKESGDDNWQSLSQGVTDNDGRIETLLSPESSLKKGQYRLHFDTRSYLGPKSFYPSATICFEVHAEDNKARENKAGGTPTHYHIPLLLSPYGYSTYKGS